MNNIKIMLLVIILCFCKEVLKSQDTINNTKQSVNIELMYLEYCYNDSILMTNLFIVKDLYNNEYVKTYIYAAKLNGKYTKRLREEECSCCIKDVYIHKEPTFEGFIEWKYNKK